MCIQTYINLIEVLAPKKVQKNGYFKNKLNKVTLKSHVDLYKT